MADNMKRPMLFGIYKILCDYSDFDHPLTQDDIQRLLLEKYGIESSRNTIGSNVKILSDLFDLDIETIKNSGIYLGERLITESEMKFLSDAIYAYSAINGTFANDLVENLTTIFSVYNRDKYIHRRYSTEKIRKKDKQFLYKLETIDTAINNKKKIAFYTFTYDERGQRKRTHYGAHKTIVSPYFTVSNMGKHYLIYKNDLYNNLSCTRIEFIDSEIDILDEKAVKIETVDPTFNIAEFMNTQNYMFSSNIENIKLKLYNENAIRDAKDWFGDNAIISYDCDKEEVYATISTDEQGLIYWALQYCDELEIIEPAKTRNRMEAFLKRAVRNYSSNSKISDSDLNFKTILNDCMSSLRWYNNLDKIESNEIIKNLKDKIDDYTYKNYKSSINHNSIILNNDTSKITINIIFLEGKASDDEFFKILKQSKENELNSKEFNKIIDILISNDRSYFGGKNNLELDRYFKIDYNVDLDDITYNGETIKFNKPFKAHWNPINKYADINQYRYAIVIY